MEVPSENLFTAPHCTALHFTSLLHCIALHHGALQCDVMYCFALHCAVHGIYLIETNEMPTTDSECQVPFSDISTYYPLSLSLSFSDRDQSPSGISPNPYMKADPLLPGASVSTAIALEDLAASSMGALGSPAFSGTVDVLKELENISNVTLQETGIFCR